MGDAACTRGAKPLCIQVEAALNDTCRELFIEGFDDKMHDGLKKF